MRFTDIFIRRPVLALALNLLVVLVGAYALMNLQIRQYPKLTNTVFTITTTYAGFSADLVQSMITQPLMQSIATVEGLDYISADSRTGVSTLTAYLQLNYPPAAAMAEILTKIQSVRSQMPRGMDDPSVIKGTGEATKVIYLSLQSTNLNPAQLTDFANRVIQPRLASVSGVASVDLEGKQDLAIRVWLDQTRMAIYGLTSEDVRLALQANNYQATPGQIRGMFNRFDIDARTTLTRPDEFEDMVVTINAAGIIRLRDIAEVGYGAESTDKIAKTKDGQAVIVAVGGTPDANPIQVAAGVKEVVPQLQRDLVGDMKLEVIYDSTIAITKSIKEVIKTIAEASVIVIVVIFLFLGSLRAVGIPIITIPLSMIGVAMALAALGFSINLLTLLAVVLAIGLVVDDAIVVLENVERHIALGKSPMEAALIGTREIAVPVISMTITLGAVYAPIAMTGGLTGSLFKEFALTLAGSVFVSGFIALTLSPMMCSRMLKHETNPGVVKRTVERTLGAVEHGYERALGFVMGWRWGMGIFALAVFASLYPLLALTQSELAPNEDQGYLLLIASARSDANTDYTAAYADSILEVMNKIPEMADPFAMIGSPLMDQGIMIGVLKPWEERQRTANQIAREIYGKVSGNLGLNSFAISPSPLPGAGSGTPVQMVISTVADFRSLIRIVQQVMQAAAATGKFIYMDPDLKFANPTVRVNIKRDKAAIYRITMKDIGDALSTMMSGGYVARINIDGRGYKVIPQAPREERLTPEAIGRFFVISPSDPDKVPIPLSELVELEIEVAPTALLQHNQLNSATISVMTAPGVSIGDAVKALNAIAAKELPSGFSVDWKGESRQFVREGSSLVVTFVLAICVIFLVLAAQFESFRDPFVIMLSVPLALSGALIPMALGVVSLNIYSQVGLITLVGLITKHGILICEVAKEEQEKHGLDRTRAVIVAARQRLRPILMTTAAMVAGLVPLLFASGAGAASRVAIGVVIVAGLSIGTLFTLFVLPVVYTFLASIHRPPQSEETAKHA